MIGGFTPGPWSASAPDGSYHDVIRIFMDADAEGAPPVAVCPQRKSTIMEVLSGSTNETTEAACNANLIAAAPELYEALDDLLDAIEAVEREGGQIIDPHAELAANAALAKARGDA